MKHTIKVMGPKEVEKMKKVQKAWRKFSGKQKKNLIKAVQKRPYIWLQENEESGQANCGCELQNSENGPALWHCKLHAAAPALLDGAKAIIDYLEKHGNSSALATARLCLREAIAKAEGRP